MSTLAGFSRKLRILAVGAMAAFALLLAVPTSATAATFNNQLGTFDSDMTSTLTYPAAHTTFTLNAWSNKNCGATMCATTYSISMYNAVGTLVWSGTNQTNGWYTVGGNVTKIVLKRECGCAGYNFSQRH